MGLRPMHDPVAQLAPPPHRSQKRNLAAIVALVLTGAGTGYRIGRVAQASMYPLPVGAAEVAVAFACREVEATRESIREALALGLGMDPGVWQLTRDLPHDLEQRAEKNPRP